MSKTHSKRHVTKAHDTGSIGTGQSTAMSQVTVRIGNERIVIDNHAKFNIPRMKRSRHQDRVLHLEADSEEGKALAKKPCAPDSDVPIVTVNEQHTVETEEDPDQVLVISISKEERDELTGSEEVTDCPSERINQENEENFKLREIEKNLLREQAVHTDSGLLTPSALCLDDQFEAKRCPSIGTSSQPNATFPWLHPDNSTNGDIMKRVRDLLSKAALCVNPRLNKNGIKRKIKAISNPKRQEERLLECRAHNSSTYALKGFDFDPGLVLLAATAMITGCRCEEIENFLLYIKKEATRMKHASVGASNTEMFLDKTGLFLTKLACFETVAKASKYGEVPWWIIAAARGSIAEPLLPRAIQLLEWLEIKRSNILYRSSDDNVIEEIRNLSLPKQRQYFEDKLRETTKRYKSQVKITKAAAEALIENSIVICYM